MFGSDVYSKPENYDLEIIGELDEDDLSYEFHMLVVWKHKDGRLFYATDSGCSCPSPFEDVHSLADLTPITKGESFRSFARDVESFPVSRSEHADLRQKVERHL